MRGLKRKIGIIVLIFSLVLLIWGVNFDLTGNFVKEYFKGGFELVHIFGLMLFLVGMILFAQRTSLDAVIIPTGGNEKNIQRAKKGAEEKGKYYLISGYIEKDKPIKESQTATIYTELRKYGVKPSEIKIENMAKDSLDNIIYSMNKLKGLKKIGIVSYPEHLKRFEYIINKAKKEGIIDKDIEIVEIPTEENMKEKMYGILANIKEKYRLRKGIENAKKNKTGVIGTMIKKIVDRGATEE